MSASNDSRTARNQFANQMRVCVDRTANVCCAARKQFAYRSPQTEICLFFVQTQRELDMPLCTGCPLLASGSHRTRMAQRVSDTLVYTKLQTFSMPRSLVIFNFTRIVPERFFVACINCNKNYVQNLPKFKIEGVKHISLIGTQDFFQCLTASLFLVLEELCLELFLLYCSLATKNFICKICLTSKLKALCCRGH